MKRRSSNLFSARYWDAWYLWYLWYPEPDKIPRANSPRYFRKSFEIASLDDVRSAFVQLRTNDFYEIYINGSEVRIGSKASKPISVKEFLRPGKNVIAIAVDLTKGPGWGSALLIAELNINHRTHERQRISTDASWKASNRKEDDWTQADYDDTKWQQSAALFQPPEGPWGELAYASSLPSETIAVESTGTQRGLRLPAQHWRKRFLAG